MNDSILTVSRAYSKSKPLIKWIVVLVHQIEENKNNCAEDYTDDQFWMVLKCRMLYKKNGSHSQKLLFCHLTGYDSDCSNSKNNCICGNAMGDTNFWYLTAVS